MLLRATEGLRGLKLSLNVLLVLSIVSTRFLRVLTRFLDILTRFLDVLSKVLVHYGLINRCDQRVNGGLVLQIQAGAHRLGTKVLQKAGQMPIGGMQLQRAVQRERGEQLLAEVA